MNINFLKNNQKVINVSKNINNIQNNTLSFEGKIEKDSLEESKVVPAYSETKVSLHPLFNLKMELLKDGFTKEEIERAELETEGLFLKREKDLKDFQAMLRSYRLLKQKFCTEDVKELIEEKIKLHDELTSFLKSRGKEVKADKRAIFAETVLPILSKVNKNNEPVLEMLLDDEDFDNTHIRGALSGFSGQENIKYGIKVLKMAQEMGYDKEFSFPLAIMISEANKDNVGAIRKMLSEQDFFINNEDFTSNSLMLFLRNQDSLLQEYINSDDISLEIIKELKDMADSEE